MATTFVMHPLENYLQGKTKLILLVTYFWHNFFSRQLSQLSTIVTEIGVEGTVSRPGNTDPISEMRVIFASAL